MLPALRQRALPTVIRSRNGLQLSFKKKSQNGGLRSHYARLATCSQREMEHRNRTTGWEMRLLLIFSLCETSATLYLHIWPKKKHVLELLPNQTYTLTLVLVHSPTCIPLSENCDPSGIGNGFPVCKVRVCLDFFPPKHRNVSPSPSRNNLLGELVAAVCAPEMQAQVPTPPHTSRLLLST